MKILLDLAFPEDYGPVTPAEISGDMFSNALPFIIGLVIAAVAVALIMTVINRKK